MLRNCSPSLKKQRGKAQEKLHKSRAKLQDAANAGKSKAQAKAKSGVKELEQLLDSLKDRQSETRTYILQLKRDAQESLKLAQGIGRVKEAVGKALSSRDAKFAAAAKKPAAKGVAKAPAKAPAKAAAKPAGKVAAAKPATKPVAAKTVALPAVVQNGCGKTDRQTRSGQTSTSKSPGKSGGQTCS